MMRQLMNLVTEALTPDAKVEQLADLAAQWVETDPLTTERYSAIKARVGRSLLLLDAVAARFRAVDAPELYRAYSLSRRERFALFGDPWNAHKAFPGQLVIVPRKCDLLTSWSIDPQYCWDHADQFEDAIIFRVPTPSLDVFLNLDSLAKVVTGLDSVEGEVLVRSAPLTIKPEMVVSPDEV